MECVISNTVLRVLHRQQFEVELVSCQSIERTEGLVH